MKTIHKPEYKALLSRLVALRHCAGMTQRELAQLLGVHHSWVAKVEIGERRLDILETIHLIRTLGEDPLELFSDLVNAIE